MHLSIFLAKIYGIIFVAVGLGILINPKYYRKAMDSIVKDHGTMYLGGVAALIVGFLIVNSHNIWVKNWTVLITIFGWIGLIKGVALLVFPKKAAELSSKMMKKKNLMIWGTIALILGLIVSYFGFFA